MATSKRLVKSSSGHIGHIGRQPTQCKCVICGDSMASPGACPVTLSDLSLLCRFIAANPSRWRSGAIAVREQGNPKGDIENAIYRIVSSLGPSLIAKSKLTVDIARSVVSTSEKNGLEV